MNTTPITINVYGVEPEDVPQEQAERVARALGLRGAERWGCRHDYGWWMPAGMFIVSRLRQDARHPNVVSLTSAELAERILAELEALRAEIARLREVPTTGGWIPAAAVQRAARALDVALNGADGAARQAALVDIVAQVEAHARQHGPLLARAAGGEAVPTLTNPHTGEPRDWRDVESDPCAILCPKPGEPLLAAKHETRAASGVPEDVLADAERFRWLTADHADRAVRGRIGLICQSIPVRSISGVRMDIDANMAAAPTPEGRSDGDA